MDLNIGPLLESEIPAADRIFRLAFGTRNGLPDPMKFDGDAARIKTRFYSGAVTAIGARVDGELVGSAFATWWGSFTWLGPLSVHPDLWNSGIAQRLLESALPVLDRRSRHLALYTVAESPKHIGLYMKFGFWPGFLTPVMEKPVTNGGRRQEAGGRRGDSPRYSGFSQASGDEKKIYLDQCRDIASSMHEGLDLSDEIRSGENQRLGDTILVSGDRGPMAFAVVHLGAGTEAGSNTAYVKFAAVRPGPRAGECFDRLLAACEHLAAQRGMSRLVAGVNTGRRGAYSGMLGRGFRAIMQGVAMHRPDDPGYDRPDAYAIDDWR